MLAKQLMKPVYIQRNMFGNRKLIEPKEYVGYKQLLNNTFFIDTKVLSRFRFNLSHSFNETSKIKSIETFIMDCSNNSIILNNYSINIPKIDIQLNADILSQCDEFINMYGHKPKEIENNYINRVRPINNKATNINYSHYCDYFIYNIASQTIQSILDIIQNNVQYAN